MAALALALVLSLGMSAGAEEYQHEHQYVEVNRVEPTCEDYGEYTVHCQLCGHEETYTLNRLGHRLDCPDRDHYNFLSNTDFRYCSRCDKEIPFKRNGYKDPPVEQPKPPSDATSLEDLSDEERAQYTVDPFSVDEYLEWLESIRNHSTFYQGIAVADYEDDASRGTHPGDKHVFPHIIADASCTTWGHYYYLPCPYCGMSFTAAFGEPDFGYFEDEPPLGHDFSYTSLEANSTCTTDGAECKQCWRCWAKLPPTVLPAWGHAYRYEKSYDPEIPSRVFCEHGDDDRAATIAGEVRKSKYGAELNNSKFSISFTNSFGKVFPAEYLNSLGYGYFAELPTGNYTLTITAEGYEPLSFPVTVREGELLDFDVYLEGAAEVPVVKPLAYQSTQTVELDGEQIELPAYALKNENGDPTNYIRVRDLAALLDDTPARFDVGWSSGAVNLTAWHPYDHPNGTEGGAPFTGDQNYSEFLGVTTVNEEAVELAAFTINYQGGGHTYYKLRDLGQALGFNVGWTAERGIFIETDKPYDPND